MTAKEKKAAVVAAAKKVPLQDRAVLVRLRINQWSERRFDRKATDAVADDNKAGGDAGKYYKYLVKSKFLDEIKKCDSDIRWFHYKNTMPWLDGGVRICPNVMLRDYRSGLDERQMTRQHHVDQLIAHWDEIKAESAARLGDLYAESDFPSPQTVRRKFNHDLVIMPIPADNDWRDIPGVQSHITSMEQAIDVDVWHRIGKVMVRTARVLGNEKSFQLRDTLCEKIDQLGVLIPKLNITDNPEVNKVLAEIKTELGNLLPQKDKLKGDANLRKKKAKAADSFAKKAAKMMSLIDPNYQPDDDAKAAA